MAAVTGEDVARARAAVAQRAPLVQCLTNSVVQTITANALLAAGAAPAMVDNVHEAAPFAAVASAVLVNVGTLDDVKATAMALAAGAARAHGTPWVLDPVAVGGLEFRTRVARDLLEHAPTVVRANASEVLGLAGAGAGGRGVDATDGVEDAVEAARALSSRTGGAVAVSGTVDVVVHAGRTVRVPGGHELLTRTTGAGCSLGALVAAYAGVEPDPLVAAVAAHLHVAVAAERAAERAAGPGSFATAWLDELDAVDAGALGAAAGRLA
ncbi:hydroxyethylthiazole kinase [Kineococcus aurantiacus]|uniref:Hydroxyethylthiazole kinase n=1 Tax=Kineococcus aurantiacus TaxID=37633 RepID=A0A7Y9ATE2_9ACTN|nr:hydroxyethylthiazole kinase [Kineococcus aurantiacus]NYD21725.1 hydroxyethylthiazole kinase [Kineococcus aurantiacus]